MCYVSIQSLLIFFISLCFDFDTRDMQKLNLVIGCAAVTASMYKFALFSCLDHIVLLGVGTHTHQMQNLFTISIISYHVIMDSFREDISEIFTMGL